MKTTKVRVVVTQRDIDHGIRGSCGFCPIALALQRQRIDLRVRPKHLEDPAANRGTVPLPLKVTRFIHMFDFDGRHAVRPFQFTVELPAALVRKVRAKR